MLIAQNKTSTSQNKLLISKIIGDLSASTTCRRQLLRCCDQLAESVSRCNVFRVELLFSEEKLVPDGVQLQTQIQKEPNSSTSPDAEGLHQKYETVERQNT